MGLIPKSKSGKISFYTSKIDPWTTNAVAIGTTAEAVTALGAVLDTATAKLAAQVVAQAAAETATEAADVAIKSLLKSGAEIIKQIRAKAATDGPDVYELAQIPAPATPTPVNELGTPGPFTAKIGGDGSLTIGWKCANPRGTGATYQIWRRVEAGGQFTFLGGVGIKRYTDNTIPSGASQVTYQVQAVRSTAVGPWAQFNVNFGTGTGGAVTASISEVKSPKAAA